MSKRMLILSAEYPYPPNHGGRVDMWNRILGFKQIGYEVHLLCFENSPPDSSHVDCYRRNLDSFRYYPRKRTIRSYLNGKYPPRVNSCYLDDAVFEELISDLNRNKPDIILLDAWGCWLFAKQLRDRLGIPIYYRSHNVEHLYIRKQYELATGIMKLKLLFNVRRMEKLEYEIRTFSDLVLDISEEDNNFWKGKTAESSVVMLPTYFKQYEMDGKHEVIHDVLYTGNLYTPNNLEGLFWFVDNVYPALNPGIRIAFAGSRPAPELLAKVNTTRIQVIPNPEKMEDVLFSSKLLINPLRNGSGVNIKMVEMLFTGKRIVTTEKGAQGVPGELRKHLLVASDPGQFVANIESALGQADGCDVRQIELADRYFGLNSLRSITEKYFSGIRTQGEL